MQCNRKLVSATNMTVSKKTSSKKTVSSIISESRSRPLSLHDRFSEFGDSECGEPLCAQRLVIDFTPDETLDNDFVQNKCCAFWELIRSHPELNNLMAMPDPEDLKEYDWTSSSTSVSSSESVSSDSDRPIKMKTAVSMLEFAEHKGLIDRTFEAKIPQSQCTFGSREYLQGVTTAAPAKKIKTVCSCNGVCETCNKRQPVSEAISMCKIFKEWDRKHPK